MYFLKDSYKIMLASLFLIKVHFNEYPISRTSLFLYWYLNLKHNMFKSEETLKVVIQSTCPILKVMKLCWNELLNTKYIMSG